MAANAITTNAAPTAIESVNGRRSRRMTTTKTTATSKIASASADHFHASGLPPEADMPAIALPVAELAPSPPPIANRKTAVPSTPPEKRTDTDHVVAIADEKSNRQRPGPIGVGAPLGPAIDIVGIELANNAFVVAIAAAGAPDRLTIADTRPTCGGSGVNSSVACAAPTFASIGDAMAASDMLDASDTHATSINHARACRRFAR